MSYVYARLKTRRSITGKKVWRFMVYGANHEPIVKSTEPYSSKQAAVEAIYLTLDGETIFEIVTCPQGYTDYKATR